MALRGPLMAKEETVPLADQLRQSIEILVEDAHVSGHGRDLLVLERRENPADAVGSHNGVRVDHQEELRPAALPFVLVAEHRFTRWPRAVDGRFLRLALAQVVSMADHRPVGQLPVALVHGQQVVEVRRAVVDHQEVHLALVILTSQRAQAGIEDVGVLIEGRNDDVDTGPLIPDLLEPVGLVPDRDRPIQLPEPFLQHGVYEDDDDVDAEEERGHQLHCCRHLAITRRPLLERRVMAPHWFPPCMPPWPDDQRTTPSLTGRVRAARSGPVDVVDRRGPRRNGSTSRSTKLSLA
jgi:hypothetical protein